MIRTGIGANRTPDQTTVTFTAGFFGSLRTAYLAGTLLNQADLDLYRWAVTMTLVATGNKFVNRMWPTIKFANHPKTPAIHCFLCRLIAVDSGQR